MNVITTALLLLKGWHLHFHNLENPEQKIRRNPGYWILDHIILVFNPPKNNVCRYWVKRTTTGDIISGANMVDLLDSLTASHLFDILCFQQTCAIFQIHSFFASRGFCLNLLIKRFWFILRTMFNFYFCETWNTALRKAIQFLCIENQIFCSISYLSAGPKLLLYFLHFSEHEKCKSPEDTLSSFIFSCDFVFWAPARTEQKTTTREPAKKSPK